MADYKAELDDAVANLDRHFDELKRSAARRLGSLFNASDYPETLIGLFGVSWDFPAIEPPEYLVRLTPDLYRREQERVRARFEEAVRLAEQAFLDQFAAVVNHLTERISGTNEDGTPEGLPRLGRRQPVGLLRAVPLAERPVSNQQLDELVAQAQRAVRNVGAQELRDSEALRGQVATQLSRVQASLDAMLVDRPRRRILRNAPAPEAGS